MAQGSQTLTTYYAKRIIGDTAAANADSALLQTGTNIATNTWILNQTKRLEDSTSKTYGIKYVYDGTNDHDKIEFHGKTSSDNATAWIQLDTGDFSIIGSASIDDDLSVTDDTSIGGDLTVTGTSKLTGNVGIGTDSNNSYKLYVSGNTGLTGGHLYLTGTASTTNGTTTQIIFTNSDTTTQYAAISAWTGNGIVINPSSSSYTGQIILKPSGDSAFTSGTLTINTTEQSNYTLYVNGTTWHTDHIYLAAAKHIHMSYNSTNYYVLHNHNNGNVSVNAASAGLYMAYSNTTFVNWMNGRMELRDGCLSLFPTNSSYREGIRIHSVSNWSNITLCGNDNTGDSGMSANSWFLGNNNGNFYIARNGAPGTTAYLQCVSNAWTFLNSVTVLGNILMKSGKTIGAADSQYRPFQLYLGRYSTSGSNALDAGSPLIEFSNSNRSQYCQLIYDDWDSLIDPDSLTLVGNQNGIKFILKNGPLWVQGGSNAGGNVNRLTTTSGMPGNMQYNTSRRGTQIYSNGIAFADPYNGNSNSDAGWIRHQETTSNSGELEIAVGDDGDETIVVRQYNTSNGIKRTLTLLSKDGYTFIPSYLNIGGHEKNASSPTYVWGSNSSDSYLRSYQTSKLSVATSASCTGNAATATALGTNAGNANTPVYFTGGKPAACNNKLGAQSANGYWGMGSADNAFNVWIRTTTQGIIPYQSGGKGSGHCGLGTSSWYFSSAYIDTITSNKTYGAVWNDIAECRDTEVKEPGRVVIETGDKMILSTERLQATARIISDTYGYCMGEPAEDGTPIAIAGRVLVYPYQNRNNYKLGDSVCAAPNGTVDIMTRKEIKEYPDRIIGIVSEIPQYEKYEPRGGGGEYASVNGRIWVYVK